MVSTDTETLYLHPDRNIALELVRATEAAGLPTTRLFALDDLCGADAWLFVAAVTPCSFGPGAELAPGESWRVGPGDPGSRRPARALRANP